MTVQIAVKLPEALASQLDELVRSGDFESRSQAVRAGLETILVEREREQLRTRYRDAFAQHPETPQELAEATRLAREAIEEEPWERWW